MWNLAKTCRTGPTLWNRTYICRARPVKPYQQTRACRTSPIVLSLQNLTDGTGPVELMYRSSRIRPVEPDQCNWTRTSRPWQHHQSKHIVLLLWFCRSRSGSTGLTSQRDIRPSKRAIIVATCQRIAQKNG